MIEYLGAEEQGMIDYIVNKVNACKTEDGADGPRTLLKDLKGIIVRSQSQSTESDRIRPYDVRIIRDMRKL